MRKLIYPIGLLGLVLTLAISCQKSSSNEENLVTSELTQDEKALVKSAGFNSNWAEKTTDGNYLIEGDILLTKAQLQGMSGVVPSHELIMGNEEHYRTTNVVNATGGRVITIRLASGFPPNYSTALDNVITRYNSYGLTISFQKVTSGGDIVISGANLGRSFGGGCILGQSAGFPDANGNPAPGFTLSTNKCAKSYLNTVDKADEVMAHEIGHAIGFRHTDYINRSSCGSNSNEGEGSVGAIHITGTPETVSGSYNSWMMACVNNSPLFSADDVTALQVVY